MRKFYALVAAMFLASSVGFAQSSVTFQVDMTGQTVSANGVHIAGDFQSAAGAPGNWDPAATALTQVGTSNIYEVQVTIPDGIYQFKFINGNAWGDDEGVPAQSQVSLGLGFDNGNSNRYLVVDGNTVMDPVLFGGNAPAGKELVTMVVDMGQEATVDDTVSVAGNFQGWSPGSTIMADLLNDSIYRTSAYVNPGDTVDFKYINGTSWAQNESVPGACAVGGNRRGIIASDTVLGPVCFGQCIACFIPDTFDVTIKVDMSTTCGFDPATDVVDVAGPFNNWPGSFDANTELTDPDNDLVYEGTFRWTAPSMDYKARFHVGGTTTNWESGNNRTVNFSGDTVLNVRCFGFEAYGACAPKADPSDITFQVDMTNGPANFVKVYLIGDFTDPAWQGGKIELTPVPGQPGVFETTVNDICPGKIAYKYMIEDGSAVEIEESFANATDTSCLEPSGTGNFNRFYVRPDDQPKTLSAPWELCASVGITEVEAIDFNVYPNPFSGAATVELGNGVFDLAMIDVTGKTVSNLNGVSGDVTLNANGVGPGVYILSITNQEGVTATKKVVIK